MNSFSFAFNCPQFGKMQSALPLSGLRLFPDKSLQWGRVSLGGVGCRSEAGCVEGGVRLWTVEVLHPVVLWFLWARIKRFQTAGRLNKALGKMTD